MTAVSAHVVPAQHRATGEQLAPVPFRRLLLVESRKLVDTRGGRGLLAVIGVLTAGAIAVVLFGFDSSGLTFSSLAFAATVPQGLLLPILAILATTSEWSQRTGLVTFSLEPRRIRVLAAKLVAAMLVAVAAVLLTLAVGALANVAGVAWLSGDGSWRLEPAQLVGTSLVLLLGVAQGTAFGVLIGNSLVAIVSLLVLPAAWMFLSSAVSWLSGPARWLDLSRTTEPLMAGAMQAGDWAPLGTSVLLWVVLPLTVGCWRLVRREVK